MKFWVVIGILSAKSSTLTLPSDVSKVAVGFVMPRRLHQARPRAHRSATRRERSARGVRILFELGGASPSALRRQIERARRQLAAALLRARLVGIVVRHLRARFRPP